MRWVVKFGEVAGAGLYLSKKERHLDGMPERLPVSISYAKRFRTRKAALAEAERRLVYMQYKVFLIEKTYPRSFAPKER